MTLAGKLHIRPMAAGDLDAVIALERETDSAPHWGPADYLGAIENVGDSAVRRIALVAEVGGGLAGFAVVRLAKTSDLSEAELESIVVAEAWRGKGIGTALLAELAARAKASDAIRLGLEVRASNAAAIRLYERAGFVEGGRRRGYYRGPDEDAILMIYDL
jgi:[ribosomal protein S18]-alanine N-acetyltransferase